MGTRTIKITTGNRVACEVTMDRQSRFIVGRFLARRCKIEQIVLAGTNKLVVIAAWHTDVNGQFN